MPERARARVAAHLRNWNRSVSQGGHYAFAIDTPAWQRAGAGQRHARAASSSEAQAAGRDRAFYLDKPAFGAGPLPSGGRFVGGAGSMTTNGTTLAIKQTTQNAVIDWNSFSIGKAHAVSIDNRMARR